MSKKIKQENILQTLGGALAGGALTHIATKAGQTATPKGFDLEKYEKSKKTLSDPEKKRMLSKMALGKPFKVNPGAEDEFVMQPSEQDTIDAKNALDTFIKQGEDLKTHKDKNIQQLTQRTGMGAVGGGTLGYMTSKKKKKKKNESKVTRKQVHELIERVQVDEALPALAALVKPAATAIGSAALRYGPRLWKFGKNLFWGTAADAGAGKLAGAAGYGTGGSALGQGIDYAFGDHPSQLKAKQNAMNTISKQQQQNKVDNLRVKPNTIQVKPNKKIDTLYSKDLFKNQDTKARTDSLKLKYPGLFDHYVPKSNIKEQVNPAVPKKLKKELDNSLKSIRKNNFAVSREFNKINRTKAKQTMSLYKKFIIEYQIRMHKLLREMK